MRDAEVRSPSAGRVLEVRVAVGAFVAAGDELVVIESMKMEIPVAAPRAGSITTLHVRIGTLVCEGDLAVTMC